MLIALFQRLARFAAPLGRDRRGATAIEYALIAALIGTAIVVGVTQVGVSLQTLFAAIASAFPH